MPTQDDSELVPLRVSHPVTVYLAWSDFLPEDLSSYSKSSAARGRGQG